MAKMNGRCCQSRILSCRVKISGAKYHECTVRNLKCRGSVIYDEVVLWDVHEVFPFLSNRVRVIRYCGWVLVACCTVQRCYTQKLLKTIKARESENVLYRYTCHGVERLYTKVTKNTIKNS